MKNIELRVGDKVKWTNEGFATTYGEEGTVMGFTANTFGECVVIVAWKKENKLSEIHPANIHPTYIEVAAEREDIG